MSEQANILAEMQQLIMSILKNGVASQDEGDRFDELETLMMQQKCYITLQDAHYEYLGEEIANLFFEGKLEKAVEKLHSNQITPEDFFAFAEYHYEDEEDIAMFTAAFVEKIKKSFKLKDEN